MNRSEFVDMRALDHAQLIEELLSDDVSLNKQATTKIWEQYGSLLTRFAFKNVTCRNKHEEGIRLAGFAVSRIPESLKKRFKEGKPAVLPENLLGFLIGAVSFEILNDKKRNRFTEHHAISAIEPKGTWTRISVLHHDLDNSRAFKIIKCERHPELDQVYSNRIPTKENQRQKTAYRVIDKETIEVNVQISVQPADTSNSKVESPKLGSLSVKRSKHLKSSLFLSEAGGESHGEPVSLDPIARCTLEASDRIDSQAVLRTLTEREQKILELNASDLTHDQIANEISHADSVRNAENIRKTDLPNALKSLDQAIAKHNLGPRSKE